MYTVLYEYCCYELCLLKTIPVVSEVCMFAFPMNHHKTFFLIKRGQVFVIWFLNSESFFVYIHSGMSLWFLFNSEPWLEVLLGSVISVLRIIRSITIISVEWDSFHLSSAELFRKWSVVQLPYSFYTWKSLSTHGISLFHVPSCHFLSIQPTCLLHNCIWLPLTSCWKTKSIVNSPTVDLILIFNSIRPSV